MMDLSQWFNLCESCVYSILFCGNEPDNCAAYVQRSGIRLPEYKATEKEGGE